MNLIEFFLLDLVVFNTIPVHWLYATPERLREIFWRKIPPSITEERIKDAILEFADRDLVEIREWKGEECGPVLREHEAQQAIFHPCGAGKRFAYSITPKGGAEWELLAEPRWEDYTFTESLSDPRGIRERFAAGSSAVLRSLLDDTLKCIPPTDEIIWVGEIEEMRPWEVASWKTLPVGYAVEYCYQYHSVPCGSNDEWERQLRESGIVRPKLQWKKRGFNLADSDELACS